MNKAVLSADHPSPQRLRPSTMIKPPVGIRFLARIAASEMHSVTSGFSTIVSRAMCRRS